MIPFILEWKVGCVFFGEQGGESIHASINTMKRNYSNIKKGTGQLRYMASTNPNARVQRVSKKKRNLKKNITLA